MAALTPMPAWAERWTGLLLTLYPAAFRLEYGREVKSAVRSRWRERARQPRGSVLAFMASLSLDLLTTALQEHWYMLMQDLRYSFRTLWLSPAFTLTALFTLAVGIGATSSLFSVMEAVLRPLPYREPERLAVLWGNVQRAKVERRGASYLDFTDWRAQTRTLSGVAAYDDVALTLEQGSEPERVTGEAVTAGYFALLGISPAWGRTLQPDDDRLPGQLVMVLSDRLWRDRFQADPAVVGKTVRLDRRSFTVVGIAPPEFTGVTDGAAFWIPFAAGVPTSLLQERGTRGFAALGRLAPGVSLSQAQAELATICKQLAETYKSTNEARSVELIPLEEEIFGSIRPTLWTLMGGVTLVLLLACVNVANLELARAETRRRELAVRTALGAGRARLIRQLMTESMLVSFAGAAGGLAFAWAAVPLLAALSPVELPSYAQPSLNMAVVLFTVGASVLIAMALGLAPALQTRQVRPQETLRDTVKGGQSRAAQRVRGVLVVTEVAMALVLLAAAGLLMASLRYLSTVHPGFQPEGLFGLQVSLPRLEAASPSAPSTPARARQLLERVLVLPGVQSAALASDLPLSGGSSATFYTAEGQPVSGAQVLPRAYLHRVTPGYFEALGIPLRAGRSFTEQEAGQRDDATCVVSEGVAQRFWPNENAVGKRVKLGGPRSEAPWLTIVGVASEVRHRGLPQNPTADPDVYLPLAPQQRILSLAVRSTMHANAVLPPIRAAVREVEPAAVIYNTSSLPARIERQTARSRFAGWLMSVFAAAALLLAAVGLYGVLAYAVAQRRRELGVRMALGASRADVLRQVVGQGMVLVGLGLALGLGATLALSRAVGSLLYGVSPTDPLLLASVAALLALVSLLACLGPAWRATQVDPILALRAE